MFPPVFELAAQDAAVRALLGDPMRLYPFGEADQKTPVPYAVWQLVSGTPNNYLGERPDADAFTVQVDVYANKQVDVRAIAKALRDAFEGDAYVSSWNGEVREPETRRFRITFTVDFIAHR